MPRRRRNGLPPSTRERLDVELSTSCRLRAATEAFAALALLAGCAPGRDLPPLPPPAHTAYTLGPGDQVRVITFGEQTLTGQFSVADNGNVALPLLGPVPAAGLTTPQLADSIDAQLRGKDLLRHPSVAVEIVTYRPVFVLGEVNKPGEYPYQPGMTMLSVVALAGGFTYRAFEDYAAVVRNELGKPIEGRADDGALLRPGDVVKIMERRF
jgi:polysaccharide biosynthesis/export protein